jgi:two-component system response regulator
MMNGTMLLVEDNPDDVKLTLRAFKEHNVGNDLVVVIDGAKRSTTCSARVGSPAAT